MTKRTFLLEVCVASADDAFAAREGGADRLEMNAALALGGLSPTAAALSEACAAGLPVVAMARPRPGGFFYSPREWRTLCRDAEAALASGAEAVAFGTLTAAGEIDRARTAEVVRLTGRRAVFHRAFDLTPDPLAALQALIDLGVTRVMTSGQEETAYRGTALIARLIAAAAGRIEVLPAAGVDRFSVRDVAGRTGCDQVHASLREPADDPSLAGRPWLRFGPAEGRIDATSARRVREMRQALDAMA